MAPVYNHYISADTKPNACADFIFRKTKCQTPWDTPKANPNQLPMGPYCISQNVVECV